MDNDNKSISQSLIDWENGDETELETLLPIFYAELKRMAHRYLRKLPQGHTFQTTELIHEAYLKLAGGKEPTWQNRAHFFGVAAKVMRQILVDYARARSAEKRGGNAQKVEFEETLVVSKERTEEFVALDDALNDLAVLDERKSRVVELRYFGGLNIDETAEVLRVSAKTVKRDWQFARNWLLRELSKN
ncbi:MAG: sigma-70 family RNA polymerase sigma factor [Pyrinomonadaceae bacterium]|nr:sigma-70 family RNA polymerase sigma factor [Pyrinomonadaceae bacterium]